ncbi:hypothetical protein M405DRAFT_825675 [Rhizopogon salebrosus TDB-379]|nr:hypothetical protein M405DRAFT_825675 [Rhizopogon salebrosus TDB-379]
MRISHPMTELPPWPDVLSPICSSLLPRGAVRFPESTTTSLSRPFNSSLTAVAFSKARAEPSASPPMPTRTYAETGTRVQRRQLYPVYWFQQTWQPEIVDMRTSSDKDVSHHPSTLFRHYGEEHSRWVRLAETTPTPRTRLAKY